MRVVTKRLPFNLLILAGLVGLTLLVLGLNLPKADYTSVLLLYGVLIVLALNFGTFIPESTFTPAQSIGMLALLSLPPEAFSSSLWMIALASAASEIFRALYTKQYKWTPHTIFTIGGMTLSFYAAGMIYHGRLPFGDLAQENVIPVLVYGIVYSSLYFLIYLTEIRLEGQPLSQLRASVPDVLLVMALPIPFAMLGALIISQLSFAPFLLYIISLIVILARQLEITRRQRRQIEELRSIAEMNKAISANLELGELLKVVYQQVKNLLNVDNVTIALYESVKLQFPLHIRDGVAAPAPTFDDYGATPLNQVLRTKYPLLVNAVGAPSWLGVPLLAGGHMLGALIVTDPHRHFDDDDQRQLNVVATTTGVALENTQLYRQQKARVGQLVALNSILALLTDTLSPDTVADTVISSASVLAESTAVAIYLVWDENKLVLRRSAGLSDQFQKEPPEPLIGDETQPVVIADVAIEPRAAALRPLMEREGKAAWIELPLLFQGVRVGVLAIYYNEPRALSPETIELLRTFANQCAQAISNARLYAITDEALERRVGQLLALANIGHHLTATFEVQAICDLVVDYARSSTGAKAVAIVRINSAGEIEQWAANGYPAGSIGKQHQLVDGGITGKAVRLKDTVLVNDVSKEPAYVALVPATRAQLSTPMLWNESVAGVITLESDQVNAFSEEDSYFVKQLANQTIIAIENARLFRKVSEARDRMQVILNTVKEGLILISTQGEIVLANPRVELMGLTPEQLIGHPLDDLLEIENLGLAERLGFRTGGEVQRVVKELRAPSGLSSREPKTFTVDEQEDPRYVERQVFPVYDEKDQPLGVLLVFYDETEEVRLAKTREEVSQMLIHDLRSPLSAVTTSLKLLTELTPKENAIRPLVESTTDAGRRAIRKLLGRVDSLLDVSKMENGFMALDTKPGEFATLVDNVCVELSPLAQELDVVIRAELGAELPLLDIDADKVERTLLNLVDNALKFSPSDTSVVIRAHEPGAEGAAPGFVRIDVVDSGPGVPDEYKAMLFDRYVQVRGRKGARRGTGLGLTFCRLVAEAHGGRIWIDDNPMGGSIFSFTLPVALDNELNSGTD